MKRFVISGLFLVGLLTAASAQAAQITGTISISQGGAVCPAANCVIPVGGIQTAAALDFTQTGALTPNVAGMFIVDGATGDFAGVGLVGLTGAIKDFCFKPTGCGVYPGVPLTSLLLLTGGGGGSFDLLTVTVVTQNATHLDLTGTGIFRAGVAGAFDPTPGLFNFGVTQTGTAFSFSATGAAQGQPTGVPEPGSMILVGTGLTVLAASVRRRLARK